MREIGQLYLKGQFLEVLGVMPRQNTATVNNYNTHVSVNTVGPKGRVVHHMEYTVGK